MNCTLKLKGCASVAGALLGCAIILWKGSCTVAWSRCVVETLEPRCLFAATAAVEGTVLTIRGSDAAEDIRVYRSGESLVVGGDVEGTFAGVTHIRVEAGAGDDSVVIAPEVDGTVEVLGGDGDDTLIGYGAGTTLFGGEGNDAFWTTSKAGAVIGDANSLEAKRGVNRLPAVFSNTKLGVSSSIAVGSVWDKIKDTASDAADWVSDTADDAVDTLRSTLKEPKLTAAAWKTADFTGQALFSESGPSVADITQGRLNDCYFLASLSGAVAADPSIIRNSIADLGDGTYVVRFFSGKKTTYQRIDADLPVRAGTQDQLAYGQFGADSSLWVALMEKAFALAKGGSYTKLDTGGWMGDVYKILGVSSKNLSAKGNVWSVIDDVLEKGGIATLGTKKGLKNSPLSANHAYSIEAVEYDAQGKPVTIVLRNPVQWATPDGDGIVRIAASVAIKAMVAAAVGFPI